MLEFEEGFFEQEIREGFYLDTTMKTVWAAELELLQKVAEVCDRHGLTWYAACGTLLGAIRHEGFVPWDDDMDIWLLREDYNKLIKLLPEELPKGYIVRSPLTETGYTQFHSFVCTGDVVSIAKEWLEQFHGCPFSVGLDIFPLDYLPRNEKDRDLQVKLFLLTGRMAQLAREMDDGEYDADDGEAEEEVKKRKEKIRKEIEDGIDYLKKTVNISVNRQLLEEEQWYELSSEIWKYANYIAMMYGEAEADDLVYFVDYTRWEWKKFPKEWFQEVYGATFENVMLPVPAGYDKVLQRIYGEYWIPVKGGASHDYPYYDQQLRKLKEYVKKVEEKAEAASLIAIEDIKLEEEPKEIPEDWLSVVGKDDGTRKKLVLSANDPAVYMAYGDRALDKLEETFNVFKSKKDSFTLWWRPYPAMKKMLDQVSPELGGRYQQILDCYKSEGWGICDETDKTERAVENCDAYYGDLNAILQKFQKKGRPIMIAHNGEEDVQRGSSTDIYTENHLYLSCADFVMDEKRIYFSNRTCNALVIVDRATLQVESMVPFIKKELSAKELHLKCCRLGNKIYFLPQGVGGMLHVYDMESGGQEAYELESGFGAVKNIPWDYQVWQNKVYLLPNGGGMGLWSIDSDGQLNREEWWEVPFEGSHFLHGNISEKCFFSLAIETRYLTITDLERSETKTHKISDEKVFHITYDGQDFWYILFDNMDIVRWNPERGEITRYHFQMWDRCYIRGMPYLGIYAEGQEVFIVSGNGDGLFILDKEKEELKKVFEIPDFFKVYRSAIRTPFFIHIEDKLILTYQSMNVAVAVDLNTLEGKLCKGVITYNEKVQDYFNRALIQNEPFLIGDNAWNLERYLYHCESNSYGGF